MHPLLLLLLLLPSGAYAQSQGGSGRVERHVEFRHYPVEGATVAELTRSLQARGPITEGRQFFGRTEWTLNAEYVWVERDTGCRAENLVVRVATTITMPRWEPARGAPAELVQAWQRFTRALEAHEREHLRLAEQGADAIRWELATLRLPSCTGAEARARAAVARIVEGVHRRNRSYDDQTRHGITEGAVWPPRRTVGAAAGGG